MKLLITTLINLIITTHVFGAPKISSAGCEDKLNSACTPNSDASIIQKTNEQKIRALLVKVIREYRVEAGGATKNENLKHVRRMIQIIRDHQSELTAIGINPDELVASLYISDMAKSPQLIKKYKILFGGNTFAAFLEHSLIGQTEANVMRKQLGIDKQTWERIVKGIVGHDGPATNDSWWEKNYQKQLGKKYAGIESREGTIHAYLDRLDQGGLYRGKDGFLQGGVRKISYEYFSGAGKGNFKDTVKYAFDNIHLGTIPQLKYLDDAVVPYYFPNGDFPQFVKDQKAEFDRTPEYLKYVKFTEDPSTVQIVGKDGIVHSASNLDEFWSLLSTVSK